MNPLKSLSLFTIDNFETEAENNKKITITSSGKTYLIHYDSELNKQELETDEIFQQLVGSMLLLHQEFIKNSKTNEKVTIITDNHGITRVISNYSKKGENKTKERTLEKIISKIVEKMKKAPDDKTLGTQEKAIQRFQGIYKKIRTNQRKMEFTEIPMQGKLDDEAFLNKQFKKAKSFESDVSNPEVSLKKQLTEVKHNLSEIGKNGLYDPMSYDNKLDSIDKDIEEAYEALYKALDEDKALDEAKKPPERKIPIQISTEHQSRFDKMVQDPQKLQALKTYAKEHWVLRDIEFLLQVNEFKKKSASLQPEKLKDLANNIRLDFIVEEENDVIKINIPYDIKSAYANEPPKEIPSSYFDNAYGLVLKNFLFGHEDSFKKFQSQNIGPTNVKSIPRKIEDLTEEVQEIIKENIEKINVIPNLAIDSSGFSKSEKNRINEKLTEIKLRINDIDLLDFLNKNGKVDVNLLNALFDALTSRLDLRIEPNVIMKQLRERNLLQFLKPESLTKNSIKHLQAEDFIKLNAECIQRLMSHLQLFFNPNNDQDKEKIISLVKLTMPQMAIKSFLNKDVSEQMSEYGIINRQLINSIKVFDHYIDAQKMDEKTGSEFKKVIFSGGKYPVKELLLETSSMEKSLVDKAIELFVPKPYLDPITLPNNVELVLFDSKADLVKSGATYIVNLAKDLSPGGKGTLAEFIYTGLGKVGQKLRDATVKKFKLKKENLKVGTEALVTPPGDLSKYGTKGVINLVRPDTRTSKEKKDRLALIKASYLTGVETALKEGKNEKVVRVAFPANSAGIGDVMTAIQEFAESREGKTPKLIIEFYPSKNIAAFEKEFKKSVQRMKFFEED